MGKLFKQGDLKNTIKAWLFAGIDIGSVFTKGVLMQNSQVVTYEIVASGGNYREAAERAVDQVLSKIGVSREEVKMVATGLGATMVASAFRQVSDISCQARGAHYLFPTVKTVIDIGGQSSRVIKVDTGGNVVDFVISERCAAGSGRFLQVMARILGIGVEDIGPLSLKSKQPIEFSTSCAVFAESETISRIAEGTVKEDILAGVHKAIAAKIVSLVKRVGLSADCVITGGGTKDVGLVRTITEELEIEVFVPEEPRITAALGAACFAADSFL